MPASPPVQPVPPRDLRPAPPITEVRRLLADFKREKPKPKRL